MPKACVCVPPPRLLIAKGLLDKVLDTGDDGAEHQWRCNDYDAVRARAKAADEALSEDAFKTIAVGVRYNDGPMRFAGIVPMRDPPRHDTGETIAKIRASGVGVKMITGDHLNIAKKTAAQIKLGQNMFANDALWSVAIAIFHFPSENIAWFCHTPRGLSLTPRAAYYPSEEAVPYHSGQQTSSHF